MFRSLFQIRIDSHYGLCWFAAIHRSLELFGGVPRVPNGQGCTASPAP